MGYIYKLRTINRVISNDWETPKNCIISLATKEKKNQKYFRFYITPARMAKINNTSDNSCLHGFRTREMNSLPLLVRLQMYTATIEINMALPQKIGNWSTSRHSYIIIGMPLWILMGTDANTYS